MKKELHQKKDSFWEEWNFHAKTFVQGQKKYRQEHRVNLSNNFLFNSVTDKSLFLSLSTMQNKTYCKVIVCFMSISSMDLFKFWGRDRIQLCLRLWGLHFEIRHSIWNLYNQKDF